MNDDTATTNRPIVIRLLKFNIASALIFAALAVRAVLHRDDAIQRLRSLPTVVSIAFAALWAASMLYRYYLRRFDNPRLPAIAGNREALVAYAWRQVTATLVSTTLALCAVLYLSGSLDPLARLLATRYRSFDPDKLAAYLSVPGSLLLAVLPNAIWDLIKLVGRRLLSRPSRRAA